MTGKKASTQDSGTPANIPPTIPFITAIIIHLFYFRIFAPATYIFFASAIPALAFGEQISHDTGNSISNLIITHKNIILFTDGILNGVHVLAATALCGFIQVL